MNIQQNLYILEKNINIISYISFYEDDDEIILDYNIEHKKLKQMSINIENDDDISEIINTWLKKNIPNMQKLVTFKYFTRFTGETNFDFLDILPPNSLKTVYLPSISLPLQFLKGVKYLHISGQVTEDIIDNFDNMPLSIKKVTVNGFDVEEKDYIYKIDNWTFELVSDN